MKKSIRIIYYIVLGLVVLIIAGLIAVGLFGSKALKIGIESAATKTLNVGVSIEDIDLSILSGKIGIEGLLINNPPGYQHDNLLELKDLRVEVAIGSLLSDTVQIEDIKLDGITIVLEQRGVSGNNLQDVISGISAAEERESATQEAGKKLKIDNLEITNITVKAKVLPIPGKIDTVTLKLGTIRMKNLGSGGNLNTAKLTSKILLAISKGIAQQGVGKLPKEMIGSLTEELKKLEKLPGALLKGGSGILEEGKDLGKGIAEGLGGLLKSTKKD